METNKPKVLYIDDAKEHIALFTKSLSQDYEIFTARSGEEGMDIMEKENVQVVISDQRMPGMSGDELLEHTSDEGRFKLLFHACQA